MKSISIDYLVPMGEFVSKYPIEIDLVYSKPEHENNHFGAIYSTEALLWCHRDIAAITLLAAVKLQEHCGWKLRLFDSLRTYEAQERMANKGFDPALVSAPGSGAHPRGMAIDVQPIDIHGKLVDMGTPFDYFSNDLSDNPASRSYTKFLSIAKTFEYQARRNTLETAFRWAATALNMKILPLPEEWWDFRLDESIWSDYKPLKENDLPDCMKLIGTTGMPPEDRVVTATQEVEKILCDFQCTYKPGV